MDDAADDGSRSAAPTTDRRRAALAVLAVVVAVALTAGLVLRSQRPPGEGSPEVAFARDMQTHHAQAVMMAAMAFDRSTDAEVRAMALDIATGQQAQLGMMSGWLQAWDVPARAVGGGHDHGAMAGMASNEQLLALGASRGAEFDLMFARLMHAHHVGGLPMAEEVIAASDVEPVVALARSMRDSQTAELEALEAVARRVSDGTASVGATSPADAGGADGHAHH